MAIMDPAGFEPRQRYPACSEASPFNTASAAAQIYLQAYLFTLMAPQIGVRKNRLAWHSKFNSLRR